MARKGSVVESQMKGGWPKPSMTGGAGMYDHGKPPFDKPRSTGGQGDVPLKFYDESVSTKAASKITPTQTAGLESRAPRPGTKQRAFGKSDT